MSQRTSQLLPNLYTSRAIHLLSENKILLQLEWTPHAVALPPDPLSNGGQVKNTKHKSSFSHQKIKICIILNNIFIFKSNEVCFVATNITILWLISHRHLRVPHFRDAPTIYWHNIIRRLSHKPYTSRTKSTYSPTSYKHECVESILNIVCRIFDTYMYIAYMHVSVLSIEQTHTIPVGSFNVDQN